MKKEIMLNGIKYIAETGKNSYRIPHALNRTAVKGKDKKWRIVERDENNRNGHISKMTEFEKQYIRAFA